MRFEWVIVFIDLLQVHVVLHADLVCFLEIREHVCCHIQCHLRKLLKFEKKTHSYDTPKR